MLRKNFFKRLSVTLASVVALGCCCLSCGCIADDGGDDEVNKKEEQNGVWNEYDGARLAFMDETAYKNKGTDACKVSSDLVCEAGNDYYMIMEFEIQAPYDNDGRENLSASVNIKPSGAVSARLMETQSGNVTEETKEDETVLTATYKIPESAQTVKKVSIEVRLTALLASEVYVSCSLTCPNGLLAVSTSNIEKNFEVEFTKGLYFRTEGEKYLVGGLTDNSVKSIVVPYMANGQYVYNNCKGNCVLSVDGKTLIAGCAGSVIPDGVTNISDTAFKGCKELTDITLPEGVASIGSKAFYECKGLVSITIPKSLGFIGSHAFFQCSNLAEVTFGGSGYEWKHISKGGPWWSYGTPRYVVHCTDGDFEK